MERRDKVCPDLNKIPESIFKLKERRSGVLSGPLIILNYALSWRRTDFSS